MNSKPETRNQKPETPIGRLAPTPSGYLHLGNAVNFVLTWLLVRRGGGQLHLRIDDLDRDRLRWPYLDNVFRVIDWLGLDYDHGPSGPDDFLRHYSQLLYLPAYHRVLRLLAGSYRSRTAGAEVPAPIDAPGVAWRARVPTSTTVSWLDAGQGPVAVALAEVMPDFVVRKKNGVPAYQLASVVDDLHLGTTLIVRGLDLLPSTAAQLWLAAQLSETSAFASSSIRLYHHDLLRDSAGLKLSKSTQAGPGAGVLALPSGPAAVCRAVAALLRLPPEAGESLPMLHAALDPAGQVGPFFAAPTAR